MDSTGLFPSFVTNLLCGVDYGNKRLAEPRELSWHGAGLQCMSLPGATGTSARCECKAEWTSTIPPADNERNTARNQQSVRFATGLTALSGADPGEGFITCCLTPEAGSGEDVMALAWRKTCLVKETGSIWNWCTRLTVVKFGFGSLFWSYFEHWNQRKFCGPFGKTWS